MGNKQVCSVTMDTKPFANTQTSGGTICNHLGTEEAQSQVGSCKMLHGHPAAISVDWTTSA